jgi:methionine sulfoxide reductase heme-binding subunit
VAYLLQALFKIEWPYLANLQANESYKTWSGIALMVYIYSQWALTYKRVYSASKKFQITLTIHKWSGALAPLFFYLHSIRFGYGYLFLMTIIFYLNFFIGNLNPEGLKVSRSLPNYYAYWLRAHIFFSSLICLIIVYHIYIVVYYK